MVKFMDFHYFLFSLCLTIIAIYMGDSFLEKKKANNLQTLWRMNKGIVDVEHFVDSLIHDLWALFGMQPTGRDNCF